MTQLRKYLLLFFLLFSTLSMNASVWRPYSALSSLQLDPIIDDNSMTIDITINSTMKVELENVPLSGYLEVYSILGVRVKILNLKDCINGCSIDLPKGLYVLRAGNVARKIIVK